MHINHRLPIVKRSAESLQFGTSAHSLVVNGLTPEDHQFIEALKSDTADSALESVSASCGVLPARARHLIELLRPVLVGTSARTSELSGLRSDRLAADMAQWSVAYDQDAGPLMERRARSVVRVIGLGRTGSAAAQALASAGIGTLLLEDKRFVAPSDVAAGAFRLCDVGLSRSAAVRRQIHHIDPTIQTHSLRGRADPRPNDPAFFAVDFVIFTSPDTADAQLLSELMHHEHAHLPVLVRERDTLVGPLVVPGETACLECIDRHRADFDPDWASNRERIQAQAGTRPGVIQEETTLALTAAGAAALQALLYIDGVHRPSSWSTVLHLRAADGAHTQQQYQPHPQCGCLDRHSNQIHRHVAG